MSELSVERKTAIEVIHFRGHTPIYIEGESDVDDDTAGERMTSLLTDSDAFVSLFYLSEGTGRKSLEDKTPIEFELLQFRRLHPDRPLLFFRRTPDHGVNPSERMLDFFTRHAADAGSAVTSFRGPRELQPRMAAALDAFEKSSDSHSSTQRLAIRYVGPDFVGLVGCVAEVLFTAYKLNIDDISHTAAGIHATVSVVCSPRHSALATEVVEIESLRAHLLREIETARSGATKSNRALYDLTAAETIQIFVNQNLPAPPQTQYHVVIRAIDAPGQISAVCRELRQLTYNIEKLQIIPTPAEYPRQRTMALLLSSHDGSPARNTVDRIEGALQYLVGVRAFSISVIENP